MTVATTLNRNDYTITSGVTNYAYAFRIFKDTDLRVVRRHPTTGVETVLVLNTDYTLTGVGSYSGGNVVLTAAYATTNNTHKLAILRVLSTVQETSIRNQGAFFPEVHEDVFDRLVMLDQQQKEEIGRAMRLPESVPASSVSPVMPVPAANNVVGWNAAANALQNFTPSEFASIVAYGTARADVFNGNGAATSFTLSSNPGALNNLDVSVAGSTKIPTIDYTWNGGTTITFTVAPPSGTNNVLVRYLQGLPQGTVASNGLTHDGSTLDIILKNTLHRVVDSIADLRLVNKNVYTRSFVVGYATKGDGGGGAYWYDSTDTTSADNGGSIIVATDGARWKLTQAQGFSVKQFGAKGDDSTNDATAFSNAITAAGTGGNLYVPAGTYKINSAITITQKITLQGAGKGATKIVRNFSGATDSEGVFNFTTVSGSSIKDMQIYSATGTTGGCLISMVPHATNGSPDFMVFENLFLTYGAVNTYKYAVYINGAGRTDNIGVRDTTFVGCEVFGGTSGALYIDTVVNFRFGGATFVGSSTSGKILVTGSGTNSSAYVNIDAQALDGLALDKVDYATIVAGTIVNQITNASSARYVMVVAAANGGYQEFWTSSCVIDSSKMNTSKATKGYTRLPNGMILQWDTLSATTAWVTKTFAIPFTTVCYSLTGNCVAVAQSRVDFQNITASGYDVTVSPANCTINIMAIGY